MPAGRPTKYTDLLVAKAKKYLKEYEELGHKIPSHVGLAIYLDITTRTLYDWGNQSSKKEFSHILEKIKDSQHQVLLSGGLGGTLNAMITKLVLGKHGYHEKQDNTFSNADGSPIVNEWHIHPVTNAKDGNNDSGPTN